MKPITAPLTPDELSSLRDIAKGSLPVAVPQAHVAKLVRLRLLRQVLGGHLVTPEGNARLMIGK